jgi:hypothetical protein
MSRLRKTCQRLAEFSPDSDVRVYSLQYRSYVWPDVKRRGSPHVFERESQCNACPIFIEVREVVISGGEFTETQGR